jgi:hypothetical protein
VYANGGYNIMVLKSALRHSDVSITQKYLEVEEDVVMAAIKKCDFTRRRRTVLTVLPAVNAKKRGVGTGAAKAGIKPRRLRAGSVPWLRDA